MFMGIVQGIVKLVLIDEKFNFCIYVVMLLDYMLEGLEMGVLVVYNGCCLMVIEINGNQISFDLMKEMLCIINLGVLRVGDEVNVECVVKFSDEIGGYLMLGYIIMMVEIVKILIFENNYQVWFKVQDVFLMKYILYKGFIGVDGISLIVGEVMLMCFCVYFILEMLECIMFGRKKLGECVNIEIDL